jgi:hypothetical protein
MGFITIKAGKWRSETKEEGEPSGHGRGLRKERGRGDTRSRVKMNCRNDGEDGSRKGTSLGWNITQVITYISQVRLHACIRMSENFGLEVSNTNCVVTVPWQQIKWLKWLNNHNTVLWNTLEQPFLIWSPYIDIRGLRTWMGNKITTFLSRTCNFSVNNGCRQQRNFGL